MDRNVFVSKEEATEILEMINGLDSDSSPSRQFVNVAHAIFRILDHDSDGNIAAPELTNILSEIMDACVEMIVGMLEEIQEILMDEPLHQIVDHIMDMHMLQHEGQNEGSGIPLETILNSVRDIIDGRDIVGVLDEMVGDATAQSFPGYEFDRAQDIVSAGNKIMKLCYDQFQEFCNKIEELAFDGQCSKEDLANIGAVCLNRIVDSIQQSAVHFGTETMDFVMAAVQDILASVPEEYPARLINIDRRMLESILSEASGTFYMHLKESGSKNYFEALLNVFDLQKCGRIKCSDLQAVTCIIDAAFLPLNGDDAIRKGEEVEMAIATLIRMVDINGDNELSKDEIVGCAKTLARFLCDLLKNSIKLLDHALISAIMPSILIALNLKSQMVGGVDTALTHADMCSVVFVMSMISGDTETIGYLKGLLAYKEGDVDEQVFENLCSNLVQMVLFWVPQAHQYTNTILR